MGDQGGEIAAAPAEERACPDRHKWSIAVTGATAFFMWFGVIAYGAHYNVQLQPDSILSFSGACAIQSVFGIFTVIALLQTIVFIISWIGICCKAKKDFYRLNLVAHTASLIAIFTGCIIFGIKKKEEIYWFFWFNVISAFTCMGNMVIWFASQFIRRREKLMKVKLDALGGGAGGGY